MTRELMRSAMHGGERLRSVVHRVAIFNKEGAITDIVSQSDVIRCRYRATARHAWSAAMSRRCAVQALCYSSSTVLFALQ